MTFRSLIVGGALALALALPAQAQTLLTGADTDEILNAARGYGSARFVEEDGDPPQITGKIEGVTYQVYFQNCSDNSNCEDINFYLGLADTKLSLEKINEWNYGKRFGRAYIDQDGDACVEMDLDLVNGVTPDYMDGQFGLWSQVMSEFLDFVRD